MGLAISVIIFVVCLLAYVGVIVDLVEREIDD